MTFLPLSMTMARTNPTLKLMNNSRAFVRSLYTNFLVTLTFIFLCICTTAQAETGSNPASPSQASSANEVNTYVTIIGGALTAVGTILGLPIVRLNQRKTKAEIIKLELEAEALRNQGASTTAQSKRSGSEVRIHIENSPHSRVQVLADPRFLAPLLLLVDFVFAWVILTLAGHVLDIFHLGVFRNFALASISLFLFLPIAKQALHIRFIMRPHETPEETAATIRQFKYIAYAIYMVLIASFAAFSALIFTTDTRALTDMGRYLGWGSASTTLALTLVFPIVRRRINKYAAREFGNTSQAAALN